MKNYGKYFQKIFSKQKLFEKMRYKYYPVPGCHPHQRVIGTRRGKLLFNRYQSLPFSAHRLYWKTHHNEYSLMLSSMRNI